MSYRKTLWFILLTGFAVKIPALFRPLTGYFGSYQAMNAMFSEMMLRGHWLDIRAYTPIHGTPSLHLLYYPFASFAAAILKTVFHGPVDFWGRTQAALLMIASGALLFEIVKNTLNHLRLVVATERIAALTVLFFTFSPINLLMGINFQNEAFAVFFLLLSVYLIEKKKNPVMVFFSGFIFSMAVVARLHFLFLSPLFLFLLGDKPVKNLALLTLGGIFPVAAWFGYIRYMEIHHADLIMTSMFTQAGEGRILKNVFTNVGFYKQLVKTAGGYLVTPGIVLLSAFGFFKTPKELRFFQFWLFGAFLTALILPQKVWDHPFYLIGAVPPLAFFAAFTAEAFWGRFSKGILGVFIGLFFLLSLRYYMPPAFSEDGGSQIRAFGAEVQSLTQANDFVIAERGTSPELLYYTNRYGWGFDLQMSSHPLDDQARHIAMKQEGYGDPVRWLEKLRSEGARYLIITSLEVFESQQTFRDYVLGHYRELTGVKNPFRIFDLK